MRKAIIITFAVASFATLGSVANAAGKKVHPNAMTCEEFLTVEEQIRPGVVYWVAGFNKSGQLEGGVIDLDTFSKPVVTAIVDECKKEPKALVSEKIKTKVK